MSRPCQSPCKSVRFDAATLGLSGDTLETFLEVPAAFIPILVRFGCHPGSAFASIRLLLVVEPHGGRTQALPHRIRPEEIEPPASVFVTVCGAKGAALFIDYSRTGYRGNGQFDRDLLVLPEVLLQDFESDVTQLTKSMIDGLWQASGFARSFDYDEKGTWIGERWQ
jgi:hypothetical protein